MLDSQRKLIFDAAKRRGAVFKTRADVDDMDAAINAAFAEPLTKASVPGQAVPPRPLPIGRSVSPKGIALIHSFEQCKLATYKDPGSANGLPITGGWGSTRDENGNPFKLGFTAAQEYWDRLFAAQIADFAAKVNALLDGVPTNQNQFDAFCSLSYNIGVGAFQKSTVLRKHKERDYLAAARAFLMWNKQDGKVLRGLTRRRLAESDLYDDPV